MREIQAVLKELHRLAQHNNQNLLKCKTSSLSTFVLIILHMLFCTSAISPTRNLTMIESYCYWRDFLVVHMLQKTLLIAVRSLKNIKKGGSMCCWMTRNLFEQGSTACPPQGDRRLEPVPASSGQGRIHSGLVANHHITALQWCTTVQPTATSHLFKRWSKKAVKGIAVLFWTCTDFIQITGNPFHFEVHWCWIILPVRDTEREHN